MDVTTSRYLLKNKLPPANSEAHMVQLCAK